MVRSTGRGKYNFQSDWAYYSQLRRQQRRDAWRRSLTERCVFPQLTEALQTPNRVNCKLLRISRYGVTLLGPVPRCHLPWATLAVGESRGVTLDPVTCNLFVGDVMNMAATLIVDGLNGSEYTPSPFQMTPEPGTFSMPDELTPPEKWFAGRSGSRWIYINAADWANPNYYQLAKEPHQPPGVGDVSGGIACWQPVLGSLQDPYGADFALPGDVVATKQHVGICCHSRQYGVGCDCECTCPVLLLGYGDSERLWL